MSSNSNINSKKLADKVAVVTGASKGIGAAIAQALGAEGTAVVVSYSSSKADGEILQRARASARKAAEAGDDGTNDLLGSNVIRTNEMQVWFLAEHLVDTPPVIAD
jgi:starvation-inducible DNA-binding protein